MTVEEFIVACRNKGFHFTANWVARRYKDLVVPAARLVTSLKIKDRVRIVQMNGCMATVRNNERLGTVVDFHSIDTYGLPTPQLNVGIMLDTGYYVKRPADPRLWSILHDGIPEYQE